jgi:NAD(P)-dependent dehydrogenase (short-subunit alcohol dehydrogenase family)
MVMTEAQTNAPSSSSRRVLITGASGALGQAVLEKFRARGDQVFAIYHPEHKPPALSGVEWLAADLTQRKSVDAIFARVDGLDAVVHCTGGFRFAMADETSTEDLRFLTALNFESSFFLASAAIPDMKKRRKGTLLFISALATQNPTAGVSAYAATKAAINAMVASLAVELKSYGIQVNAVLPSVIDTPANRKDMPHADPSKWVSPEDIADLLYDLTMTKSKSITGALIPITGRM